MTEMFDAGTIVDQNGTIGNSACRGNADIVRLWIPKTVKSIENSAFADCTRLEEVTFEFGDGGGLDIGLMVFQNCTALRKVSLPARLKSIAKSCFRNCNALVDLTVGRGETSMRIDEFAFVRCANGPALKRVLDDEAKRRAAIPAYELGLESTLVNGYDVYPSLKEEVAQSLPAGIPDGTVAVCVDQTWGVEKSDPTTKARIALEDCARGYWCEAHLRHIKLSQCGWLMAVARGRIEGFWKIDRQNGWRPPEEVAKPTWPSDVGPWQVTRLGCKFLPDDDEVGAVRQQCVGKPVNIYFRQSQTVRCIFVRH